jgi:predicted nucleic acid-binding protein
LASVAETSARRIARSVTLEEDGREALARGIVEEPPGPSVLGEFYVNAVRKQPAAQDEARAEVRDLLAWNRVIADAALLERGWKLQDRYQLSHWDALIGAAAKAASCHYLLTEDLQTGQMLDGIEVVNPFLRDPESLL